eukprot:scaffold157255_cov23-Tisochrysis_lutea.AAC.2
MFALLLVSQRVQVATAQEGQRPRKIEAKKGTTSWRRRQRTEEHRTYGDYGRSPWPFVGPRTSPRGPPTACPCRIRETTL